MLRLIVALLYQDSPYTSTLVDQEVEKSEPTKDVGHKSMQEPRCNEMVK